MTETAIRILLVEDNRADAVLLQHSMRESKFGQPTFIHVTRLSDALIFLATDRCDIVLLDLGLPDSQGLHTLDEMQKHCRGAPIVVLTGLADEAVARRALQRGAQDFLMKGEANGDFIARAVRYVVERKAGEATAKVQEIELAHLARVALAGQMASGLAHELNQPLAAILNYATAGLNQLRNPEGSRETAITALEEIVNETRRAGAIISRLRAFLRKRQPQLARASVNELVEQALGMIGFELRHRAIHVRTQLATRLPPVQADAVLIGQVLVNLFYNAMEALSDVESSAREITVETSMHPDGTRVIAAVIDRGAGVTAENMPHLFNAFFSTKPSGLGLGLNISRSIIESHGDQLTGVAEPAGGMRFSFALPVAEGGTS